MGFTATCPGCGAPLPLTGGTKKVTCTFCGTSFEVDLSQAQPKFQRQTYVPPEPEKTKPAAEDLYGSFSPEPPPPPPPPAPRSTQSGYSSSPARTNWRESVQSQLPPQLGNRVATWGKRALWTAGIITILIFGASCFCFLSLLNLLFHWW